MNETKRWHSGSNGYRWAALIQLLEGHPWFEIDGRCGLRQFRRKTYAQAARWMLETAIPDGVANLTVQTCQPGLSCDFVLSGLPSDIARETELELAKSGLPVISNAGSHRMEAGRTVADSRNQSRSSCSLLIPRRSGSGQGVHRHQSQLLHDWPRFSDGGRRARVRTGVRSRRHDAGDLWRRLSGRRFARHSRQRHTCD